MRALYAGACWPPALGLNSTSDAESPRIVAEFVRTQWPRKHADRSVYETNRKDSADATAPIRCLLDCTRRRVDSDSDASGARCLGGRRRTGNGSGLCQIVHAHDPPLRSGDHGRLPPGPSHDRDQILGGRVGSIREIPECCNRHVAPCLRQLTSINSGASRRGDREISAV